MAVFLFKKWMVVGLFLVTLSNAMDTCSLTLGKVIRNNWCACNFPPLFAAAQNGDIAGVALLISKKYAIDEPCDSTKRTPLWIAAFHGHTIIVEQLIDAGANSNAIDYQGWTPLIAAITQRKIGAIGLLLKRGANLNLGPQAETPLELALRMNNMPLVRALLWHGAFFTTAQKDAIKQAFIGEPFIQAAVFGECSELQRLWYPSLSPTRIHHALVFAVAQGHQEVVHFLLNHGPPTLATRGLEVLYYVRETQTVGTEKYKHYFIIEQMLNDRLPLYIQHDLIPSTITLHKDMVDFNQCIFDRKE